MSGMSSKSLLGRTEVSGDIQNEELIKCVCEEHFKKEIYNRESKAMMEVTELSGDIQNEEHFSSEIYSRESKTLLEVREVSGDIQNEELVECNCEENLSKEIYDCGRSTAILGAGYLAGPKKSKSVGAVFGLLFDTLASAIKGKPVGIIENVETIRENIENGKVPFEPMLNTVSQIYNDSHIGTHGANLGNNSN